MKLVRWPVQPLEQDRRNLEDRLLLRAAGASRGLGILIARLPLGSRSRKAVLSHGIRSALAAISRGDYDRLLTGYDPQVEVHWGTLSWASLDFDPVHRGHDGIRLMMERLNDSFASLRFEPREVIDAGGGNFACQMDLVGVGRGSGATATEPEWHVYRVERGRVVRQSVFPTEEEALAALADAAESTG